jgi:nicotinamidase-related amidase
MERPAKKPARAARLSQPGVVLIDTQPGFLDMMSGSPEPLLQRLERLLLMADCLRLPTLATFEEPDTNGWLPSRLEQRWPGHGSRFVKRTYDCCGEPQIAAAVAALGRRQLLVAGAETDVCVLQSVLSLLERGSEVFLLEDCVFSSEPHPRPALQRMYAAGAVPCTLKTVYYELMRSVAVLRDPSAGGDGWARLPELFGKPEDLPPWEPAG